MLPLKLKKKANSRNNVQVCMETSTRLYKVEKKASLLHFLIEVLSQRHVELDKARSQIDTTGMSMVRNSASVKYRHSLKLMYIVENSSV